MENNITKEAVHVEFFGLPGSGKSTISHEISNKLKEERLVVSEPSYDILYKVSTRFRLMKKMICTIILAILLPKKYIKLKKLVKKNGYKNLELYKQVANIAYKIVKYNFCSRKKIYVWDEGIVQSAISLSMFNSINAKDNLIELLDMIKVSTKIVKVLIVSDFETIKIRLQNREGNHSRVEKMDENAVDDMLSKIAKCVEQISDTTTYIYEKNNEEDKIKLKEFILNI